MTGPEHYREAERLAGMAHRFTYGDGADPVVGAALAAEAQVHATLALTAATVVQAANAAIAADINSLTLDRWYPVTHGPQGKDTAQSGESTPAETTIYRASHDSIVMGLYTTRQAAYEHCEAHELRDDSSSPMTWELDEDGTAELMRERVRDIWSPTGFVVTPLTVASEYDEEADE